MSSLIGHTLIGAAIGWRRQYSNRLDRCLAVGVLVFLAICPDLDYPIYWLLNIQIEPRITHSFGFCSTLSGLVWWLKSRVFNRRLSGLSGRAIVLAGFSHLLLDGLVGVHPMPLFWPLTQQTVVLPFGVLPSAGHLSLGNFYLWRNLTIELGILLPIARFIMSYPSHRKTAKWKEAVWVLAFLISLVIGLNLER